MRTAHMPMETTSPGSDTTSADRAIAVWSRSGSQARQIAAALGRELLDTPRHTRVDSSMKIAARFGANKPVTELRHSLLAR